MSMEAKKTARADEIRICLASFVSQHFDDELRGFAYGLLKKLSRMRKLDITRGRPEIWAGTVVYIVGRLNFLFDQDSANHVTPDQIAEHFAAAKTTLQNKATMVEKAAGIRQGGTDFTRAAISEMFAIIELPNGFVVTFEMFKKNLAEDGQTAEIDADGSVLIRDMNESELEAHRQELETIAAERQEQEELAHAREERRSQQRRKQEEARRQRAGEKRQKESEHQPDLFEGLL